MLLGRMNEDHITNVRKCKLRWLWARYKINRTCKDDPTGHGTRMKKERQTEKEIGRQYIGMDGFKVMRRPLKG